MAGSDDGALTARYFRVRGPLLLKGGGRDTRLFETETMTGRLKIYADGGENDLHAHPGEDHVFIVLDGEAVFFDKDGAQTVARKYDGVLLPRGTFYRFRNTGEGNVVMLRIGVGDKFDGPGVYRVAPDGEPLRHNLTTRDSLSEAPVESGLFFGDEVVPPARYEGPMISADSHVIESATLWSERLPKAFADRAPQWPSKGKAFQGHPGGWDPHVRLGEMATDGVSAEVLFPSLALRLFAMRDADLQRACFRVYNDWLAEYCSVATDRLIGIALLSAYDIDAAVAEAKRCRELGMRGVMLWQAPPEGLELNSPHYDPLWAAIADLGMPLSLHILSGFDWSRRTHEDLPDEDSDDRDIVRGGYGYRGMTNYKLLSVTNALHDLIFSGALERHPGMRLSLVESEIGWIPFILERWDKYYRRPTRAVDTLMAMPSEIFARQVYATFIDDDYGTRQLSWWGAAKCMWSSDFPHVASSWPDSRDVISRCLAGLPVPVQERLGWKNCAELYGLQLPSAS